MSLSRIAAALLGCIFFAALEPLPVRASPHPLHEDHVNPKEALTVAGTKAAPVAALKPKEPKRSRGGRIPLAHLSAGQRVKIEGRRFEGNRFVARVVELVEGDDDEFEIEGVVRKYDTQKGILSIGSFHFLIYEKTKFENRRREPVPATSLKKGIRVKVKAKRLDGGLIKARTIRLDPQSSDRDIEIEAEVEEIHLGRSEITVIPVKVAVNRGTEFKSFGLIDIDQYTEDSKVGHFIRRDDDEQHPDPIRVGPAYIGGKTEFGFEATRNLDLDVGEPDSDDWYRARGQVEIAAPLGEYSEVYAKFNFARGFYNGSDPNRQSVGEVRFREGFLYLGNVFHRSIGLQIGRQRFRDKREWLYDERLDGVRLHVTRRRFKVEMSVAQSIFAQSNAREDQLYLIGYSQYRLPGRRYLSGYLIKRNDTSPRDEDPIWYGVSSRGRVSRKLDYWAEFSQVRGRRGSRKLRGYGYDLGASYELPLPWGSTVSGGYAFGSGDRDFRDGVDSNFRQTRLNDNSYRYNGLKRYRYYGVALEPELFNIKITTLDYGIRPSRTWSFNASYHTYRQAVADDNLGDTELAVDPTGKDPRLGKEIDFIVMLRKFRNIDIHFLTGIFFPGPAFKNAPGSALVVRPGIRYYF